MTDTEKTFTVGDTRVSVMRDEYSAHPWERHALACRVVCWDQSGDIAFEGEDKELNNRPASIKAVNSPDTLLEWIKNQTEPFCVIGVVADKYGFFSYEDLTDEANRHKDVDLARYYGVLILDKGSFNKYIEDTFMPDAPLIDRMKDIALYEAALLQCWYGNDMFGFIVEKDKGSTIPFKSGIEIVDSVGGVPLLKGKYKEMLAAMADELDDNTDALRQIKEQMLAW
jgi:hypothetical protein